MNEIDFLPVEYRQKHAQRQSQPWQIVVAVAIVGLVSVAAISQSYRKRSLEKDLAMIASAYDEAEEQQKRLMDLQKECKSSAARAELYTYLKHPWPRSQLLSALVKPLPDSITLHEVEIQRQTPSGGMVSPPSPLDSKAEEDKLKTLTPAERDQKKLSSRVDPLQTVVILNGSAIDVAALHRYIGELDSTDIFEKAELDSLNSVSNGKGGDELQFRAILSVQPGYGQPGGPTP